MSIARLTNEDSMNKYGSHDKLTATKSKGHELVSILIEASKFVSTTIGCGAGV
ncbi:MAG: hypothetical protein WEA79_09350 [Balneolaceae bacterium]